MLTVYRRCSSDREKKYAVVALWEGNGLSIRLRRVRFSSAVPITDPGLCNGSTTDFDSVSLGSIPSPGAKYIAFV